MEPALLDTIASSVVRDQSQNASEKEAIDINIVEFSGDDPWDPMNQSSSFRWLHVALLSYLAFVTTLGDVSFAPGVPVLLHEFNVSTNSPLSTLVISLYSLGTIAGNILGPPLSEWQGRLPVLHISNGLFVVFIMACALSPNINSLVSFRFLSGAFGSVVYTLGNPIIGDLFPQEKRGATIAVFSVGQLIGPVIGPVIGGFLAQDKGWRWIFWLMAILWGMGYIPSILFLRESYRPVLLQRKVLNLRKTSGNQNLRSKYDTEAGDGHSVWKTFLQNLIRPAKMFLFLPMVTAISLYLALIYGYIYNIFTRLNEIYSNAYHFSSGDIGLTYLGVGLGLLVGTILCGATSDWYMEKASAGGEKKPEYRLPPLVLTTVFVPTGLFIYGWTAKFHLHWILPLVGTALVGFGFMTALLPSTTYLVDCFPLYAASAISVTEILLALSGALFPLIGPPIYSRLALGWGNSLLGFLAMAFTPLPFILLKYGERIRTGRRSQISL